MTMRAAGSDELPAALYRGNRSPDERFKRRRTAMMQTENPLYITIVDTAGKKAKITEELYPLPA